MTAATSKSKTSAASKAAASVKADPQPSTVSSAPVKSASPQPPKKRKRVTKKAKTAAVTADPAPTSTSAPPPTQAPPPAHTLVIDNGGDTIKFGWNTDSSPQHIPNVTARLQQQWTVLAGDQLSHIQNPNQLICVTRSMERGMIVNLGNQVQVWKRLLDLLGVSIPIHTETAQAFGWKAPPRATAADANKKNKNKTADSQQLPPKTIAPANCAVLITVPPHCPRSILDQILQVWSQDFGFCHVGLCVASACAAAEYVPAKPHADYQTCCLVDLGWSATQIVPTFRNRIIGSGGGVGGVGGAAIRRLPVAGRHMINMWKYFVSYRQWNLMDQEWILRNVLHETAYCSMQFGDDMRLAQRLPAGRRPYDREYVLPDHQNNFQGSVRLPPALQKEADGENEEEEVENSDDDSDVDEQEMQEADDEEDDDYEKDGEVEEEKNSDDEESPAEIRGRLLKRREEEQRRRREEEEEQQVLNVTVERFSIPETLFRPSDVGLPSEIAGLPAAIVQSIEACPGPFQAALYQSIHLVGGLSQLPNLKERLERELRALAPCQYEVVITASDSPIDQAWIGACKLTKQGSHTDWSVSVGDSDAGVKRGEWKRLLVSAGGHLV